MIDLLKDSSVFKTLINSIDNNLTTVFGCDLDAKLTAIKECGKSVFFVTSDIKEAVTVKEKLTESNYRVALLNDKLNFELNPFSVDYNIEVLDVLNKIVVGDVDAVIVNPMFLAYFLPSVDSIKDQTFSLKVGDKVEISDLTDKLVKLGFSKSEAPSKNEFSVKGDMIDICNLNDNIRVYFDFDEISNIKTYDKETLLNTGDIFEYNIFPSAWFNDINNIFDIVKDQETLELLDSYRSKLNNILWCMPFNDLKYSKLFDYAKDWLVAISDTKSTYDYLQEEIKQYNSQLKQQGKFHEKLMINNKIDFSGMSVVGFQYISNQNRLFNSTKVFNIKSVPVPNYVNNFKLLAIDLNQNKLKNYTTILYGKNKDGVKKLESMLTANNIKYNVIKSLSNAIEKEINVIERKSGISVNLEVEKVNVISSLNLFGRPKPVIKNTTTQSFSGFLPESGDYVVHSTHGVGICLGVECLKLSSAQRDYVVIEYKNHDKLYLPVENIDLIDKYIGDQKPQLNKLGGTEFLKAKEKVKNSVKTLAFDLNKLYAERNSLKGFVYPEDDEVMKAFEDEFGYEETPDQLQAIMDIKTDMTKGKIMDRLICGDVGFGKTEVALRGAFKTILSGKQVALLCPTTILSQQHYNTALYRMKNFGVNIKVLNRFCTTKEIKEILSGLENGEIDLIVGTHKLLGKNVKFKNLGLLILDEEQKFGVGDKEKIKNLKKNINVLTLSATPIPRTLNMSLTGIRDISVIETPPVSRIPTAVKVCEQSDEVIKTAIQTELDRSGQVLVVYNKVESIYEFALHLRSLVPNAIIDVAHGQMDETKLENAIFKLYNNETQILISTTLIENGIDLPNANTLIVIDADMLGLSQLYQLKGRVGRSDRQAFAYFMFNSNRILNENALKRLEAITEYTSMGSGFKIAMRDLEIRGAGSIFGAEQSGHIEKVGYAMYLKLLNNAVSEIKGEKVAKQSEIKIETSESGFIPNDYILDYNSRLSAYLKISKIDSSGKLNNAIKDMSDVYGAVPSEVVNLCKFALIKNLASNIGIKRVVIKPNMTELIFSDAPSAQIIEALSNFKNNLVLENGNTPIIKVNKFLKVDLAIDLIVNFLEFVTT